MLLSVRLDHAHAQRDIKSAFTVSMKVVLLVRVQRVLKKRLLLARKSIAASRAVKAAQQGQASGTQTPDQSQAPDQAPAAPPAPAAAPPPPLGAEGQSSGTGVAGATAAIQEEGIPEGMARWQDSDDEVEPDAAIINELIDGLEQADLDLHLQHVEQPAADAGEEAGTCTQQ